MKNMKHWILLATVWAAIVTAGVVLAKKYGKDCCKKSANMPTNREHTPWDKFTEARTVASDKYASAKKVAKEWFNEVKDVLTKNWKKLAKELRIKE